VSPLRGEKPQNRPLSKRNTGRFALRAMLPVKTCHRWLRRRPLQMCHTWCTSAHGRLLGEWVRYNLFLNLFMPLFPELIYRSNPSTDFPERWLKRRRLAQGCAFLGFVDMAPHLAGQIPSTPILGAWIIGVFKPNSWNRKTCIIILSKLLHRFQPNFAQW